MHYAIQHIAEQLLFWEKKEDKAKKKGRDLRSLHFPHPNGLSSPMSYKELVFPMRKRKRM